jgi:hypothetical protein
MEKRIEDSFLENLEHSVTRRDFTLKTSLALLSGVLITISGCGGGDSPTASPTGSSPVRPVDDEYSPDDVPEPSVPGDVRGVISANHGHVAVISGAQLTSAQLLQLDIRGNADHTHTVELSSLELTQIANGQRVSKASTFETAETEHNHTVTFN